jgi:epoxyqueuosine reductase QueG
MANLGTDAIDRQDIPVFFHDRGIGEFAVVAVSSLHAPAGRRPSDLLPSARTVILFGAEMAEDLFSGSPGEIITKVRRFEATLRNVADDLVSSFQAEGFEAVPVRSIMLRDGTIKGLMSLNHCAADAGLGRIGDNRLLITPRFGSRIGLGAVVTSKEMEETPRPELPGEACNHCNRCITACPELALSPGELDLFRCRNVSGSVPGFIRPFVFRFIRSGERLPFSNRLLNKLASRKVNLCAGCLTSCPHFRRRPPNQEA